MAENIFSLLSIVFIVLGKNVVVVAGPRFNPDIVAYCDDDRDQVLIFNFVLLCFCN